MEILKADSNYKRKSFKIYLLLIAIGIGLILFGLPEFKKFIAIKIQEDDISSVLRCFSIMQFMFFVPLGVYSCLLAWRTLKSEQFPPPGQKVYRDTRIRRGNKAKWISYLFFINGALAIAFPIVTALVVPPLIEGLVV